MCGILGIAVADAGTLGHTTALAALDLLFRLSESRGKEAAGVAVLAGHEIVVLKGAVPASRFVASAAYRRVMDAAMAAAARGGPFAAIGHSRLVTTGALTVAQNNQPAVYRDVVGVHNGIVVNYETLWAAHPDLERRTDLDSEVIFALLHGGLQSGSPVAQALAGAFRAIDGTASVAALSGSLDALLLASNNGSLYYHGRRNDRVVFASERSILARFGRAMPRVLQPGDALARVGPGSGVCVDLARLEWVDLRLGGAPHADVAPPARSRTLREEVLAEETSARGEAYRGVGSRAGDTGDAELARRMECEHPHSTEFADTLRRCSRCILPETMPFVDFDETGTCNYCRGYQPVEHLGEAALRELVRNLGPQRRCVVGVSGGRDSLFTLHVASRVLGLDAVAYTYDWGMVTDLARRNISRICARLGVEHIVVSADIARKRAFIRKNVEAWLRTPDIGLVPLFMAGDKLYFHYLRKVSRETGSPIMLLGENELERTDFKTGFAGVRPHRGAGEHVYSLSAWGKLRLARYYLSRCVANRGLINASLADSALAYLVYYFMPKDFINLYRYVPWVEEEIVSTLRSRYDFELADDYPSTWRIGDGTAAFYNHIYFKAAGFTENDTFRSNQVREGQITREEALRRVAGENRPRYESIVWYLRTIGLAEETGRVFAVIDGLRPRAGAPAGGAAAHGARAQGGPEGS